MQATNSKSACTIILITLNNPYLDTKHHHSSPTPCRATNSYPPHPTPHHPTPSRPTPTNPPTPKTLSHPPTTPPETQLPTASPNTGGLGGGAPQWGGPGGRSPPVKSKTKSKTSHNHIKPIQIFPILSTSTPFSVFPKYPFLTPFYHHFLLPTYPQPQHCSPPIFFITRNLSTHTVSVLSSQRCCAQFVSNFPPWSMCLYHPLPTTTQPSLLSSFPTHSLCPHTSPHLSLHLSPCKSCSRYHIPPLKRS